jgi:signal transduction histidine kinase
MKKQGHGLGLAMVRKAVIMHRGRIEVESKVGTGSTFIVTLPGNL